MRSNSILAISALFALCCFGCTAPAVRYSPDEIKDYPPEVQENIRQGDAAMGMTTQQVRYALGSPATVNVLSPSLEGKPREEWIYSSSVGFIVKRRLLFIDGKLADIYPEAERAAVQQPEQKTEQPAEQPAAQPAEQSAAQPAEKPDEKTQDGQK